MKLIKLITTLYTDFVPADITDKDKIEKDAKSWYERFGYKTNEKDELVPDDGIKGKIKHHLDSWYSLIVFGILYVWLNKKIKDALTPKPTFDDFESIDDED